MNNMKEVFESYSKEKQERIKANVEKLFGKLSTPTVPPATTQPQQPT
jgi:hypothetical protein